MRSPLRSESAGAGPDRLPTDPASPAGYGTLGTTPPGGRPAPRPGAPSTSDPLAAAAPVPAPAERWSGPTAAADPAGAGDPRRSSPSELSPPRPRASGTTAGGLRVVPGTPTAAPGPRPAPAEPGDGSDGSGPWALVRSAQAGDMNAFSELFDRYYDVVFRYVLFRMNDRTLAEDITQETFLRALRRITSVTYQGRDIGAWFVTIARNLIFAHVKSSRYRLESTTSDIVELSPSTHGPEQQVLDLATNEELLRCVRKLNADQQECISLRFLQGLSVAETAKIMDRNEGAVKALQHRAVRRLAQLLPEGLR
jgi:RNA polymerase sigma-70 factor, ECF subfamily